MPLVERVAAIRRSRRSAEEKASIEEARAREIETKFQEEARARNLRAFDKFVQALSLKKSLEALAEKEGLENPEIQRLIKEPVAKQVELRLVWKGEPKREYQENVIPTRPKGFFSISIEWGEDRVTVSGRNIEEIIWTVPLLFDSGSSDSDSEREKFEESIAKAYLNPRWNEEPYQIQRMPVSKEPIHYTELGP